MLGERKLDLQLSPTFPHSCNGARERLKYHPTPIIDRTVNRCEAVFVFVAYAASAVSLVGPSRLSIISRRQACNPAESGP